MWYSGDWGTHGAFVDTVQQRSLGQKMNKNRKEKNRNQIGTSPSSAPQTISIVKDVVEVVAIVTAAIWAFYVFVYQEHIRPAHEPSELTITANISPERSIQGLVPVRIHFETKNTGQSTVFVLGGWYSVLGYKVSRTRPLTPDQYRSAILARYNSEKLAHVSRFVTISEPNPIHNGFMIEPKRWWLEPGESVSGESTIYVPKEYVGVKIAVTVNSVKKDHSECVHTLWEIDQKRDQPTQVNYFSCKPAMLNTHKKLPSPVKFDRNNTDHIEWRESFGLVRTEFVADRAIQPSNDKP